MMRKKMQVLNLIINGLPSIQKANSFSDEEILEVLNLIINGLPSILEVELRNEVYECFKKF